MICGAMSDLPVPGDDPIVTPMSDLEVDSRRSTYWHDKAEEARVRAAGAFDPAAREMMEAVASNYETLAALAMQRGR